MREPLTREAIVDATRQLILDEGLGNVTLRRLAQRLQVTAPALYAHVTDKEDLLRAVAEDEFAMLLDRFETVPPCDPLARMQALSRAYVEHTRERPSLFPVMFLFPPRLEAVGETSKELPLATKVFAVAADAAAQAVAAGQIASEDPLMVALTSWACVHGVATVLQLGFAFDEATEQRLIDSVLQTVLAGLTAGAASPPRA